MAEKRRFLDVWIVEANTVYKEVPFDVIADWVQQGRLLEDDMLRPAGTSEWARLGDTPGFAVYVPKPVEPGHVESKLEATEPIETGVAWKRRRDDEETDVDMIPLIDVSLVLLIFFMLKLHDVTGGGPQVATPPAVYGTVVDASHSVWVGINLKGDGPDRVAVYSCGFEEKAADKDDDNLPTRAALLDRLQALLERVGADKKPVDLTINANPDVQSGAVRELTVDLESPRFRSKILKKYTGVSEKKQ